LDLLPLGCSRGESAPNAVPKLVNLFEPTVTDPGQSQPSAQSQKVFVFLFSRKYSRANSVACDLRRNIFASFVRSRAQTIDKGLECLERRETMMLQLGWKAGTEQYPPAELLEYAIAAEAAGFDSINASDHFHPWG
jgi:hypothetical protein